MFSSTLSDADSQGLTDCEKFGLIKRINTIEIDELTKYVLHIKYKQVFHRLGNLGKYHITLQKEYKPVGATLCKMCPVLIKGKAEANIR